MPNMFNVFTFDEIDSNYRMRCAFWESGHAVWNFNMSKAISAIWKSELKIRSLLFSTFFQKKKRGCEGALRTVQALQQGSQGGGSSRRAFKRRQRPGKNAIHLSSKQTHVAHHS